LAQLDDMAQARSAAIGPSGRVEFRSQSGGREHTFASLTAVAPHLLADDTHFRRQRLPLAEIVFRVLLLNGNRPMPAEELAAQVEEWTRHDGRVINADVLDRIAWENRTYGIAKV